MTTNKKAVGKLPSVSMPCDIGAHIACTGNEPLSIADFGVCSCDCHDEQANLKHEEEK